MRKRSMRTFPPVLLNLSLPVCRKSGDSEAEPLSFRNWERGGSRQERQKIRMCILDRGSKWEKPKELCGGAPRSDFCTSRFLAPCTLVKYLTSGLWCFPSLASLCSFSWVISLSDWVLTATTPRKMGT